MHNTIECPPESRKTFDDVTEAIQAGSNAQSVEYFLYLRDFALMHTPSTGVMLCHIAASGNSEANINIIRELKAHDPHIYERTDKNGLTPLHYATIRGCNNMAMFLMQDGHTEAPETKYMNRTPLHGAAARSDDLAYALINTFLYRNRDTATYKDINGDTPIHIAAQEGSESAAQAFRDAKCDLSIKNDAGETPYNIALKHNQPFAGTLLSFSAAQEPDLTYMIDSALLSYR